MKEHEIYSNVLEVSILRQRQATRYLLDYSYLTFSSMDSFGGDNLRLSEGALRAGQSDQNTRNSNLGTASVGTTNLWVVSTFYLAM